MIAVVEPVPFQRTILVKLLEAEGVVEIGESAGPDDIVFMPAADFGAEQNGRVIVTAPESEDALLADCIARGAAAFCAKPFTRERVAAALRDVGLR